MLKRIVLLYSAPIHINYLYTDMQTRKPNLSHRQIHKEKWSDFMKRIGSENKKNIYMATPEVELPHENVELSDFMKRIDSENKKNIYMATPEIELPHENIDQSVVVDFAKKYIGLAQEDIDQSVVDFVKKYDKGTLVKLR